MNDEELQNILNEILQELINREKTGIEYKLLKHNLLMTVNVEVIKKDD